MEKRVLLILLVALTQIPAHTQNRRHTISGFVRDSSSRETLPGAVLKSRSGITVSNAQGFFSLATGHGQDTIKCTHIGYKPAYLAISPSRDTTFDIILLAGEILAESVVSSGYIGRAGHISITADEILSPPSVFSEPDILKTLQMMPGVQGGMEGTAGIMVRGGGPDENLFLLDGVPMYNVSHLLGVFSAFTPEALKKLTLYKGSFPARYGGRVSSIVDIRTNDGDLNDFHGSLGLGLLTGHIHLDGPVVNNKTTASFTARGLNTIVAAPFLIKGGYDYSYYFYDLNGKIVHRFSKDDNIALTFYRCRDDFDHLSDEYLETTEEGRNIARDATNTDWGNTLVSFKWNHVFSPKLFISTSLSGYWYNSNSNMSKYRTSADMTTREGANFHSDIKDAILRAEFDYTLSRTNSLHFGAEGTSHIFAPSTREMNKASAVSASDSDDTIIRHDGFEASLYTEDEMNVNNWLHADFGVRFTFMNTKQKNYSLIEPRISLIADVRDNTSISASYSKMSQYVHLLSSSHVSLPTDIWIPITDRIRPVISDQVSLGVRCNYAEWEAGAEAYYKHSDNILEYKNGVSLVEGTRDWGEKVEMGEAVSKGIEFLLRKNSGRTTGWMSYTLAKSDHRFPDGSINNGEWFPYHYDRRHSFLVNVNHKFSDALDVGVNWTFKSGEKISIPNRMILAIDSATPSWVSPADYFEQKNNYTLPATHHLDVSLNWRRKFKHGRRVWNLSVYNVYNKLNPNMVSVGIRYDENGNEQFMARTLTYLPVLPSMFYTYYF